MRINNLTASIALIIDDPQETILITGALRPAGYEIRKLIPMHSLGELSYIVPDIIIIQVGWNTSRDLSLIQDIRLDSRFDDVPILALSMLDGEDVRHHCLQLGCQSFMIQPVSAHELRSMVQDLLAQ